MNVPVIMRDSGFAPDSVHRGYGGHSSSQQRQVLDLPVAAMMGFFDAFCVIFRAPPVVPELSASFSALDDEEFFVVEGSRGVPESPGV